MSGFLTWLHPRRSMHAGAIAAAATQGPDGTWGLVGEGAGASPVATITGQPVWHDAEIAAIASTRGHAAALLAAHNRYRDGLLAHLGGAFALVVLDPERQHLLAAIDRTGQGALCFAPVVDGVAVATCAGLLLEHPHVDAGIAPQAIYDYLHFHMIPAPLTAFRGMHKLQAAHYLRVDRGAIKVECYWMPAFREDPRPTPLLEEELQTVLQTAVARNVVPGTGTFLSGGLDSSTVTGLHARVGPGQAHAFSIGFNAEGYDEIPFARTAAKHFDVPLSEYYVTPADVADAVRDIASAYDEPFGNSSALPALFCARMAHSHGVKRLLAGDGGDELFAGNTRYAKQQVFERYARVPAVLRRGLIEPALAIPIEGLALLRKARNYVSQANIPLPERMQRYSFLQQIDSDAMLASDFRASIDPDCAMAHLREIYHRPRDTTALNRMLYLDWQLTLADSDLRKVIGMCHLAGVEVAFPMLDDDVVELSCRVPSNQKMHRGRLRHFYKEALRGFLPDSILDKRKQGFGLPFGIWLRDDPTLHEIARESLRTLQGRGWFRHGFLDQVFDLHLQDHPAYWGELVWILMILGMWLQHHESQRARSASPNTQTAAITRSATGACGR